MIIEALINKEACVNGTSKMTRVEKNQFLKNESLFFSPLDFAMCSNSQVLINKLASRGASRKHEIIEQRREVRTGFIPTNQYQGERPSTSTKLQNAISLLRYLNKLYRT